MPTARRALTASSALLLALVGACGESVSLPGDGSLIPVASRLADVRGEETPGPRETEHVLGEEAEEENKEKRDAWFEERHRAAPDIDWRAIEQQNANRQRLKRNGLSMFAASVDSKWTERGSDNVAGRMHVAAPATDGAHLYAGSSRGGLWRGTLDGTNWQPLADHLFGGVHWLAVVPGVNPGGPDAVVVTTDGGSIHVSHDDGVTWQVPAGLPATVGVRRALVRPGTDSIFLMVQWWESGQLRNALYRSTDRGSSFTKSVGMTTYRGDVWTPRDTSGPLYLLKNDTIQISNDDGVSWSTVGSTGVSSSGGELSGSEAGAPRLYAILDVSGAKRLYRSDDAGASFAYKQDVSDYWGSMAASAVNADLFAWGGVEVHRTTTGGNSFSIVNNWWEYYGQEATKLHADVPGIDVVPDGAGGETWYISTDGGLFRSQDGLSSVTNLSLSGLRVGQYYGTHTSTANPDHVLAGAQDQGYQRADLPATDALDFDQLISGDYAHLTSSTGAHNWVYSVYPGFVLVHKNENNPILYQVDFPANQTMGWLPMVHADPDDAERWFLCAETLWRYQRNSPFNSWSMQQWSTHDFSGSGNNYMSAIDFSPIDSQRAYAATNDGRLFYSTDKGKTWTQSVTNGPDAHYFHGTALVASKHDVDTVYVGGSGYGSTPGVWRSTDGGVVFVPWSTGLPQTLVYDLAEASDGSGALFAATETAAYMRVDDSSAWVDITQDDAPVTTYWSVEAVDSADVMRFGTYGRGIWDFALDDECAYEAIGLGLGGANVISLDTASSSFVGGPHVFDVSNAPPLTLPTLLASTGTGSAPLLGGTLLVDPVNLFIAPWPIATDALGNLTLTLTIPNDPVLYGIDVAFQLAASDAGQPKGWAFSNGLSATFCAP